MSDTTAHVRQHKKNLMRYTVCSGHASDCILFCWQIVFLVWVVGFVRLSVCYCLCLFVCSSFSLSFFPLFLRASPYLLSSDASETITHKTRMPLSRIIETRRANVQTIDIRHTYTNFSQLSPLHNQHHEHLGCFMQCFIRMTARVLVSRGPVTFTDH